MLLANQSFPAFFYLALKRITRRAIVVLLALGVSSSLAVASDTESNTLVVTAYDYAFVAPSEVKSGWTRIELDNQRAEDIHEVTIVRIPDGIDYQTYLAEFIRPWMDIWRDMKSGEVTSGDLADVMAHQLPEWGAELDYRHARGILAAGEQAAAYAYLPAGTYAVECWLKTEDGHVHIAHGMIQQMAVTSDASTLAPPSEGISITIDESGVSMPEKPSTGRHVFIAEVAENEQGGPIYPDLHLVRVDDNTKPEVIVEWLNWFKVDGLTSPAPAHFLGGYSTYGSALQDNKAYFEVNIAEPGEYAWVIQSSADNPIWHGFTVSE